MKSTAPGTVDAFYAAKGGIQANYRASYPTRLAPRPKGMPSIGVGADFFFLSESNYWYIVELARYHDRNDCIFGTAVNRVVDNVIQRGFKVDPETGRDNIDEYLAADWERYSCNAALCDSAKEHDLHQMSRMALRGVLIDGDTFDIPRANGSIQTLECHRVRSSRGTSKNVILGIEEDEEGERTRYWVTRNEVDVTAQPRFSEIERIEARDNMGHRRVWHHYLPKRTSQRRGVSVIAPICAFLRMHDDTQFAKLVQSQAVSAIALFHELPVEAFNYMTADQKLAASQFLAGDQTKILEEMRAGLDVWARFPGERLTGFSPAVPNAEWFKHVMLILTIISVNLGIPVQILLLDPSQTNFSGWRGAVDQARIGLEQIQTYWAESYYSTKYRRRIRWLAANDAEFRRKLVGRGVNPDDLDNPKNAWVFQHKVHPPRWRYIEPVQDITARVLEVGHGLITPVEDASRWGRDWRQVMRQTIAQNAEGVKLAKKTAAAINKEFPDDDAPVNWQQLWSPITPDNVRVQIQMTRTHTVTETEGGPAEQQPQPQPARPAQQVGGN